MAQHNEKPFETELAEYLHANGWLYSANSSGYDRQRALFPEDVLGWLGETQPAEFARAVSASSTSGILDRLVKTLDKPLESGGGTLAVLRRGFTDVPVKFRMAQFKPATGLNPTTSADYGRMRLRVMRQVFYSKDNNKSIDLVLFVNGLPVATIELKTDFTQSVQDAISQYRTDRLPKGEPLLSFGHRALVHFAVSNSEVYMTTKLDGAATRFLPFNRGNDGRAGNPLNPARPPPTCGSECCRRMPGSTLSAASCTCSSTKTLTRSPATWSNASHCCFRATTSGSRSPSLLPPRVSKARGTVT